MELERSIEQEPGGDIYGKLDAIDKRLARMPVAPTEVFHFDIDPAVNTQSTRQATHVKVNIAGIIITADPVLAAAGVLFTFHLGSLEFHFHFDVITNSPYIPLPVKWDRGVDAWFTFDVAQTEFHGYVIGSVE